MLRDICNHLCVFTLFVTLYVSAQMSLFKRYVTIFTPVPLQPPVSSISHLCLRGECLHNADLADLNAYATLMRRNRDNTIKTIDTKSSATSWQQIEYVKQDVEKSGRALSAPNGLNTPPRPVMKGVSDSDYMKVHKAVAPNKLSEKEVHIHIHSEFIKTLDTFERKFYMTTFTKLRVISPVERKENGVSFVQSGFFLYITLVALSLEVDLKSKVEIEKALELSVSDQEKIEIIKGAVSSLPKPSPDLNFRWAHRLAVNGSWHSRTHAPAALGLRVNQLNHFDSPPAITSTLNRMVQEDSGGVMRCAFSEGEVLEGVHAALLSTMYLRARWRTAPTLLNGTHAFYDGVDPHSRNAEDASKIRETYMIRLNDIMRYANLREWDAEALEIFYSTPHLSFLIVAPRQPFLQPLAAHLANTSINDVIERMRPMRIGVKLPIYTLRMTLLLHNKLEAMGIIGLLDTSDRSDPSSADDLKISHAVQQLMFWAEAGRHAFKDDGLEWAEPTELELSMNRPYVFYLRWKNFTIANGNFVL